MATWLPIPGDAAVLAERSITLERLQKALSPVYLRRADTNLSSLPVVGTADVLRIQHKAIPDLKRPLFHAAVAGAAEWPDIRVGASFSPTWSTHWLRVILSVPEPWRGALQSMKPHTGKAGARSVYLVFDSNSEAAVYSATGRLLQGLTGGDAETLRSNRRAELWLHDIVDAEGYAELFVEVACNGLFGAGGGGMIEAPDPTRTFTLATCKLVLVDELAERMLWDFVVLTDLAESAAVPSALSRHALLTGNAMLNAVCVHTPATWPAAAAIGAKFFEEHRVGASSRGPVVCAMGHCHIDTAWLWSFGETRRKIARSWAAQTRYMATEDGEYVFGASQMVQYQWLLEDHPALFDAVRHAVAQRRWAVVGGTWVEPDANIPSGEALVRQFLHGIRFERTHFGAARVAAVRSASGASAPLRVPYAHGTMFLPDTFGYCAQLPQIIRGCGLRYFLTQKLSWSLVNKPLHSTFWWSALDGSPVLVHFPPADNYNAQANVADVLRSASQNKDSGQVRHSTMLFGNGDGGGGPNLPMFRQLHRLGIGSDALDGMPALRYSDPSTFFDAVASDVSEHDVVTWDGELFLELHSGTLTSQAWIKCANRRCEDALVGAEAAWVAALLSGAAPIIAVRAAHEALQSAWRDLLVTQFHDVLPGSSIAEVYADSKRLLRHVLHVARASAVAATELWAKHVGTGTAVWNGSTARCPIGDAAAHERAALPAFSFNTSPGGSPVFEPSMPFGTPRHREAHVTAEPQIVKVSTLDDLARTVSASRADGHAVCVVLWVPPAADVAPPHAAETQLELQAVLRASQSAFIINNGLHEVWISCVTGHIVSWIDLESEVPRQLVVLGRMHDGRVGGAGALLLHSDVPWFWDAWDTFVYRDEKFTVANRAADVRLLSVTSHAVRISCTCTTVAGSSITQLLTLRADSRLIEYDAAVDWKEAHKMLRVAFPLALRASHATYETQFGCLDRPVHTNTSREVMQYEVCGHRWATLCEPDYGVTLMNDSKYGYSCRGNMLALSLLRAPKSPDPDCDIGRHTFRYAITCHRGHIRQRPDVVDAAAAFNAALTIADADGPSPSTPAHFTPIRIEPATSSIRLSCLKIDEDGAGDVVVRLYEALGVRGVCMLETQFDVAAADLVNLVEEDELHEGYAVTDADAATPLLACAAPAVQRAFARHPRPSAPSMIRVRPRSIRVVCSPFQIVTIRLKPA